MRWWLAATIYPGAELTAAGWIEVDASRLLLHARKSAHGLALHGELLSLCEASADAMGRLEELCYAVIHTAFLQEKETLNQRRK